MKPRAGVTVENSICNRGCTKKVKRAAGILTPTALRKYELQRSKAKTSELGQKNEHGRTNVRCSRKRNKKRRTYTLSATSGYLARKS